MMIKKLFTYSQAIFSMALALSFSACTDEVDRDPSPVQTEGVQAYFYQDEQTDYSFLPDEEQTLTFTIGRQTTEAATVHLTSDNTSFTVPQTVDFAAGEISKEVTVTFNLEIGESASLTLTLGEGDTYTYGAAAMTFNISRDYTWVSAGTAVYTESAFGLGTGSVAIEQAKENPSLYRLKNLYESLAGAGQADQVSLQFTLDEDYQALSIIPSGSFFDLGVGYWFLYDAKNYPQYCYFVNEGKNFELGLIISQDQNSIVTVTTDSFIWEGWPGEDAE